MTNNFNNLDGELNYEASLGLNPIQNNPFDEDNFYPADGGCGCGCNKPSCIENQSMALGGLIPSAAELKKARAARLKRRDIKTNSKAQTRVLKATAKNTQADSQKLAAQNLGTETASDVAIAQALANSPESTKSSLSKGAKIGIAVGVVLVLSTIGYVVYKKMHKSK